MILRRLLIAGIAVALLALVAQATSARAAWRAPATSGSGASGATLLPAGTQPSVAAGAAARSVAVSWATVAGIPAAARYRVVRTPNGGGAATTVCNDVATVSCTDTAVPTGTWRYAVAVRLSGWTGAAGTTSAAIAVAAPAMSLSPATITSLPGTTSATLTGFAASETVTFRLDSASGTVLTTSPATTTTSASGGATATVTIPSGTTSGAHTVYATGAGGLSATAALTVTLPTPAVTLTATTFATLPGTTTATVAAFGASEPVTFRLDSSSGTSLGTATANASGAGSGSITIPAGTTSGAHTVYAVGGAGSSATQAITVSALGASPTAMSFTNGGSTSRQPDNGDSVTLTFDRELQPRSICSAWSATSATGSTTGTVRLSTPASGRNTLEVTAMTGCTSFGVGAIDMGRTNMTTTTSTVVTFNATIAWSNTNKRITITLSSNGSATGGSLQRLASGNTAVATYTPAAWLRSLAGAAVTGTFSTAAIVPF